MIEEAEYTSKRVNSRSLRVLELMLVVFVAFGAPLLSAIYIELFGTTDHTDPKYATLASLSGVVSELAALAVLLYVLFRQGRRLSDLSFSFNWKDVFRSLPVFITSMIAFMACYRFTEFLYKAAFGHPLQEPEQSGSFIEYGVLFVSIVFLIVNPVFEELIVRAFVMTDIKGLTGSTILAILVSVGIQGSYHLYEGLHAALALSALFLVYALYYARYKRIMPVILAHLYTDLLALQHYHK